MIERSPSIHFQFQDTPIVNSQGNKESQFGNVRLEFSQSNIKQYQYVSCERQKLNGKIIDYSTKQTSTVRQQAYQHEFIKDFNVYQDNLCEQSIFSSSKNPERCLTFSNKLPHFSFRLKRIIKINEINIKESCQSIKKQHFLSQIALKFEKLVKEKVSLPEFQIKKKFSLHQKYNKTNIQLPNKYSTKERLQHLQMNKDQINICNFQMNKSQIMKKPCYLHYFTSKATPNDRNIAKKMYFKYRNKGQNQTERFLSKRTSNKQPTRLYKVNNKMNLDQIDLKEIKRTLNPHKVLIH